MTTAALGSRALEPGRRYEARLRGLLHPGLPFYTIALLPLFWAMGLGFFTFAIAAVPMGFGLLVMKPIRVPRGMGLWFLFVGWMIASAAMLEPTATRFLSFGLRAVIYIGATIIFLYVYNIPQRYLPTSRILGVVGGLFLFTAVVGGYLGLVLGEVSFATPAWSVLPGSIRDNSFVSDVFRPPFAQTQDFLGFPLNRPAMPFSFTNDWGATLVPASFLAIAAAGHLRRGQRLVPLIALVAAVPMIVSANRGLWIALVVGVVYVTIRRASSGQALMAIRLILVVLLMSAVVLMTPLGDLVGSRTTSDHSFGARSDIYTDVIEAVPESPIIGFGAPLANPDPNRPAIGTHGMFWTALFSQGIPGAFFYAGFWLTMAFRTGVDLRNQQELWLHLAVASALPTMLYYDHLPAALPLMLIAAAVFLRDRRVSEHERVRATAGV